LPALPVAVTVLILPVVIAIGAGRRDKAIIDVVAAIAPIISLVPTRSVSVAPLGIGGRQAREGQ
jgi:hypothetical protein